jgi:hypothetical protein
MEKHERRQFLEGARDLAPSSVETTIGSAHGDRSIPDDHRYALVEVLTEGDDGIYVRTLATGDDAGITHAWEHGQENHPRPKSLRLVDLKLAEEAIADGTGEKIDFH